MKKTRIFSKKHFRIVLAISMTLCLVSCSYQNNVTSKGFFQKRKYTSGWFVKSGKFQNQKNEKGNPDRLKMNDESTAEQTTEIQLKRHIPERLNVIDNSLELMCTSHEELKEENKVPLERNSAKLITGQPDPKQKQWRVSAKEKRFFTERSAAQFKKAKTKGGSSEDRSTWSRFWKVLLFILILLIVLNLLLNFVVPTIESTIALMIIGLFLAPLIVFVITYFFLKEREDLKKFILIAGIPTLIMTALLLMVELVPLYFGYLGAMLLVTSYFLCIGISFYYLLLCLIKFGAKRRAK
ncbi:MAG: hypothetical protein AB8B56_18500 [Crocinitomicaceae bacterium]